MAAERQAVLVFSNAAVLDRARRGWPRAFEQLFECNDLLSWTNPGFDVHVFTSPGFGATAGARLNIHYQQGSSFGERLENAVQTLTDLGYRKVVVVGSDCPDLEVADIQHAFRALKENRLVLGPDHRGGCYLIGLNVQDRHPLHGVRWQRNTDFEELLRRFGRENCWQLSVKLDLDSWNDVCLLAKSASCWRELAASLLRALGSYPFDRSSKVCPRAKHERLRWQLPPPRLLSLSAL
jgi:hypothetical protein